MIYYDISYSNVAPVLLFTNVPEVFLELTLRNLLLFPDLNERVLLTSMFSFPLFA